MKVRITPLNIVSALALVIAVSLIVNKSWLLAPVNQEYSGLMIAVCFLFFFLAFLGDQVFRKLMPSLIRLWLLETSVIIFTLVLMSIMKGLFFNS
ncbi:hypothetical protein [Pedobacter montanisoli]|uniref:Uncharacterized protein n=1 Tax=Pedobacter montanisoli TaxID=2923277 RepID=A0ABS9ZW71_9SPHI|nr:hypothetical protein [Pedobacter montanisoli]MCJ0742553.1 hypothetical protein [Pedobacter montanisoli]